MNVGVLWRYVFIQDRPYGDKEICVHVSIRAREGWSDSFWQTSWLLWGAHYGSAVWSKKVLFLDNEVSQDCKWKLDAAGEEWVFTLGFAHRIELILTCTCTNIHNQPRTRTVVHPCAYRAQQLYSEHIEKSTPPLPISQWPISMHGVLCQIRSQFLSLLLPYLCLSQLPTDKIQ